MTTINSLPAILFEPVVRSALLEDLGRAGDITTDAVVPPGTVMEGAITAREAGTIAGADAAALVFRLLDPKIECQIERPDGTRVAPGDVVMRVAGFARAILSGERVALNLLCHLSGVATATAALVDAVRPYRAGITCTRKTTPGLRALEKHAVRVGGGSNHRFGLDDAVLIKDNHIAIAGDIRQAIERARDRVGHLVKIEVEVDTLAQLEPALAARPDAILLDNMNPHQLGDAVKLTNGRAVTEASGRVTLDTVSQIAASGVDLISVGWITHSVPSLDLGLDVRDRTTVT